jgi:hypothetical protein
VTPDLTASIRARLLRVGQQTGEEFERTLVRFAAERWLYRLGQSPARERCVLKGAGLLAVAGCFERRGTPWSEERPEVLTRQFYEHDQLRARWSGYVNGSAVQEVPPLDFTAIGDRLIAFLGPVREAIVGSEPLNARWVPAQAWERT